MAAALLQLEHHLGKTFVRDLVLFLFFPGLRYLVVLAVDAPKIAVAEEDISRSLGARQAGFFAKVGGVAMRQLAAGRNNKLLFHP